jgi:hypothetical protein
MSIHLTPFSCRCSHPSRELVEWPIQPSCSLSPHTLMHKLVTPFYNSFHKYNPWIKERFFLTFFHYEITPKRIHMRQLGFIVHLMAQLVSLPQELHNQISFDPLLRHSTMMLHLPLYAFKWLGFTLNHVS